MLAAEAFAQHALREFVFQSKMRIFQRPLMILNQLWLRLLAIHQDLQTVHPFLSQPMEQRSNSERTSQNRNRPRPLAVGLTRSMANPHRLGMYVLPAVGSTDPADGDTLRDWIKEGRVASNSLLWRDGWPQWREAKNALLEIADQLPSAESAPDTPISTPNNQTVEKTSISEDEINDFGFQELEASSPQQPAQKSPALNEANHKIGAQRRAKNSKRIVTIGMLIGTAVLLLAGVVYLAQR